MIGIDVDAKRVREGTRSGSGVAGLLVGAAETLPFAAGTFDVVLLNEVIEHVQDDRVALEEALRVLSPGGHVVVYAPNRLFPLETHGVYWRGAYHFGNYPFVNYLPETVRDRLVPHARAYTRGDMARLVRGWRPARWCKRRSTPASTGFGRGASGWAACCKRSSIRRRGRRCAGWG